ncbi:hypothetical protein STVA_22390 [Allostella vacuolata]|nr:hypothetical protein STVA_22390 [Stella vacuolata]
MTTVDTEIRNLFETHAAAIRRKDAEGALAVYAPGVVRFDLAPPLATAGEREQGRQALVDWFATWRGGIGYELRDLAIIAEGGLALCHGFLRISGTKADGEEVGVWTRRTVGLRREAEAWRIVHEHGSVPFYMDGSLRAAVDLQPPAVRAG